ncbi:MAG: CocE/NonD family hydrolase [Gammaproteobacteria bacterium]|nr:CocE/NonD family hydrolase [Gammaproteobacteria bacterium]
MNNSHIRHFSNSLSALCFPVFLLLILMPALGFSQEEPVEESTDPDFALVTSTDGDLLATHNVSVSMRDGINLSVNVYRPVGVNTYSTLYAAGPLPHTEAIPGNEATLAGPISWYVSQGYAVVLASVRGTGLSEGEFSFFARNEQQDHYEVIEWIAAQPWSDGQVAGTGAGYYATAQWQMAIQNPPHLECIAPINGALDPFREWIMPGGLANNAFILDWFDSDVRIANANAYDTPRLVSLDLRLTQLSHPFYDDFWQIRNNLDSASLINIPVFALHEWSLANTVADLTGTIEAMDRLNVINKLLVKNPGEILPIYKDIEFLGGELLPFYEWCFNDRRSDSVFIEQPRIRYQVQGLNTIKPENNWPPGNIAHEAWFLNSPSGNLDLPGSLSMQQQVNNFNFRLWNRKEQGDSLEFISMPLENDLEISGPVMTELYVSSSSADRAFEVTLYEEIVNKNIITTVPLPSFLVRSTELTETEEAATVTRNTISRGALKATARARDSARSTDYLPVYSLEGEAFVAPGQSTRLDIAMRQTAYRFKAGSRLVLEIKPANDGSLIDVPDEDILHHNIRSPSRVWLPVVQSPLSITRTPAETAQPDSETEIPIAITIPATSIPDSAVEDDSDISTEESQRFFVPR